MKVTAEELIDNGLWERYCELSGTDEWAINEGLMELNHEIELTDEECRKLFLRKED